MAQQDYTALTTAHEENIAKGKAPKPYQLTVQLTPEEEAERARVGDIAYRETYRAILAARGVLK